MTSRTVAYDLNPFKIDYTPQDAYAIKGLAAGTATPEQQKHALWFIQQVLGQKDDQIVRPAPFDSDKVMAFLDGRRFVALQLKKLIEISPSDLENKDGKGTRRRSGSNTESGG